MKLESENSTSATLNESYERTCCLVEDGGLDLLISEAVHRAANDVKRLQQEIVRWEEEELSHLTSTDDSAEVKAQMYVKQKTNNYLEIFFANRRATVEWCTVGTDVSQGAREGVSTYQDFPDTDLTATGEMLEFLDYSELPDVTMAQQVEGFKCQCGGQSPTTSFEETYDSLCSTITDIVHQAAKDVNELRQSICHWEAEEQSKLSADEDDSAVQRRVNEKVELYLESYFAGRRAMEAQCEERYPAEDFSQRPMTPSSQVPDMLGSMSVAHQEIDTLSTEVTNEFWQDNRKLTFDTMSLTQQLGSLVNSSAALVTSDEVSEDLNSQITEIVCQSVQDVSHLKQTICRWEEEERSKLEPDVDESVIQSRVSQKVERFLQIYFDLRRALAERESRVKLGEYTFTEKDLRGPSLQWLEGYIEQNQNLNLSTIVLYDISSQTFNDSLLDEDTLPQDVNLPSTSHPDEQMPDTSDDARSPEKTDVVETIDVEEADDEESEFSLLPSRLSPSEEDSQVLVQSTSPPLDGTDVEENITLSDVSLALLPSADRPSSVTESNLEELVSPGSEDKLLVQTSDGGLGVDLADQRSLTETHILDTEKSELSAHLETAECTDDDTEVIVTSTGVREDIEQTERISDEARTPTAEEEGKPGMGLPETMSPVIQDSSPEASRREEVVLADVTAIGDEEEGASEKLSCTGEDVSNLSEGIEYVCDPLQELADQDGQKKQSDTSSTCIEDATTVAEEVEDSPVEKQQSTAKEDFSRKEQSPTSLLLCFFFEDDEPFISCLDSESSRGQSTSPLGRPTPTPICSPQDTIMAFSPAATYQEDRAVVPGVCKAETKSDVDSALGQSPSPSEVSSKNIEPTLSPLPDVTSAQLKEPECATTEDAVTVELGATYTVPGPTQDQLDDNLDSSKTLLGEDEPITEDGPQDSEKGPSLSSSKELLNLPDTEICELKLTANDSIELDDVIQMTEDSIGKDRDEVGKAPSRLPSPFQEVSTSSKAAKSETPQSLLLASSAEVETALTSVQFVNDVEKEGHELSEHSQLEAVSSALGIGEFDNVSDVDNIDDLSQIGLVDSRVPSGKDLLEPELDEGSGKVRSPTQDVSDVPLDSYSQVIFSNGGLNTTSIDGPTQADMYPGLGLSDSLLETSTQATVGSAQRASRTSDFIPPVTHVDQDELPLGSILSQAQNGVGVCERKGRASAASEGTSDDFNALIKEIVYKAARDINNLKLLISQWEVEERSKVTAGEDKALVQSRVYERVASYLKTFFAHRRMFAEQSEESEEVGSYNVKVPLSPMLSKAVSEIPGLCSLAPPPCSELFESRIDVEVGADTTPELLQLDSQFTFRFQESVRSPSSLPSVYDDIRDLDGPLEESRLFTFRNLIPDMSVSNESVPGVPVPDVPGVSVCDGLVPDESVPAVSVSGWWVPDMSVPDMSVPGMSVPGMSVPGMSVPGMSVPGMSVPDMSVPGMSVPDMSVPGMSVPGMSVPGMSVPGMSVPDMSVPGMSVPGMSVPAVSVPGVSVPGVSVPGMSVSGVSVPGMSVPGMSVRGMSVPGMSVPGVSVPDVSFPDMSVPGMSVPGVSVPDMSVPGMSVPGVSVPGVSVPDMSFPDVSVPGMSVPGVSVPGVSVPDVSFPYVSVPGMSVPGMSVPGVSVPDVSFTNVSVPSVLVPGVSGPHVSVPGVSVPDESVPAVSVCDGLVFNESIPDGSVPDESAAVCNPLASSVRLISFTNGNLEVEITPQVPPVAPSTTAFFLLDSDDKTSEFKPSNLVEDINREDSGIGSELPEGSVFSVAPSRSSTPATFLQQAQIVYEQVPTSEVNVGLLVKEEIDSDLKLSEGRDWINMAAELGAVTLHDDKDPRTTERNTNLPGTSLPIIEDMPLLDLTFLPTSSSTYLERVRSESPLEKMKANVDQTVEENRVLFIPSLIEDDPAPVPTAFITSSTDFVSKVSYQEGQDESLTWMVVSDSFGGQLPDATRLALLALPESTSLPEPQEYPGQPVRVEMEGTPQLFTSNMGPALEEVYPQAPLEINASLCVEERSSEPLMVGVPDVSPLMEMKKVLNVIMRQFFDGLSERNLREMSNGIDNLMVKEQLVSMCMSVLEMATRAFVSLANCQDTDGTSSPASCGPSVTLMVDLEQRTSSLVKESTDQNFKMFLVNAISDLADENTTIQTPPEIKDGILNTVTEEVNCILSENIQNSLHSRHSGTNFCQMSTCRLCRKIMARVAREIKLLIKGRRTKKVRPRSSSKADLYPLKLMEQTKGDFANLEPPNLTEVSMKDSSVLKKPSLIKRFWGQLKCKE